jgi:tetratricopeptide (TPR) repeat protein
VEQRTELYDRATRAFNDGKYPEAAALFEEIIADNPRFADVYNKLGIIAHLSNFYSRACTLFKKAIEINPSYTEASMNLAITLNAMGEFDQANEVMARARQIAKTTPQAIDPFILGKLANDHFRLGNIYLDMGMNEDAIDEYKKAIKLQPKFPDVLTNLGVALRNLGQNEDALQHLRLATIANPSYLSGWVQLGITHTIMGKKELAIQILQKALAEHPHLKQLEGYLHIFKGMGS